MKVKTIYAKYKDKFNLSDFPNFSSTGSVTGMKKQFYGQNAFLIKCGSYIYNVTEQPEIYYYFSKSNTN